MMKSQNSEKHQTLQLLATPAAMKLIITLNKNKTLKKLKTHLKKLLTNKLIKTPNNDKRKRERDFFFQKINKNNNKQIKNKLATAI